MLRKPFIIHTTKIDIKVLGTRFDVKSYPSDKTTEATLIRGSIEVSFKDRPTEKIILKPNEKIVVANTSTETVAATAKPVSKPTDEPIVSLRGLTHEEKTGAILETAWVDNKLIFRDESFPRPGRNFRNAGMVVNHSGSAIWEKRRCDLQAVLKMKRYSRH